MVAATPDEFENVCSQLGYTASEQFYRFDESNVAELPSRVRRIGERLELDAVYGVREQSGFFRPIVYFVDDTRDRDVGIRDIYNGVWNEGSAPILVNVSKSQVKIYNCTQPPIEQEGEDLDSQGRLFETLEVYTEGMSEYEELDKYSRRNIESRSLWQKNHSAFDSSDRVDRHLFDSLKEVQSYLTSSLSPEYANNLIVRSIFLLYLEDNNIVPEGFYKDRFSANSYRELLPDEDSVYHLFEEVSERLNGDIFQYTESEQRIVESHHLEIVKKFLNGTDLSTGQTRLFPYRFDLIPIELISSIYENFVANQGEDGTYYTRPELAEYMLGELLPENISDFENIIDPACGSGVFLVSAFRRAVESELSLQDGIPHNYVKQILEDRIYGCDTNKEAIQISAFSLSLKLLDYVDANEAWSGEFELPKLIGENLHHQDFFDYDVTEEFDLVIGNPPWGKYTNMSSQAQKYIADHDLTVGNNEISQPFIWKSLDALSDDGKACLAVPLRGTLLNRSSQTFRNEFFEKAGIETVVNLAPLRRTLFENADSPAGVLVFTKGGQGEIEYIAPKSFELDALRTIAIDRSHDVKYLDQKNLENKYIWKVMMWGGVADLQLIRHLQRFGSFGSTIRDRDWMIGNGFQNAPSSERRKPAPELASLPNLPTRQNESYYTPDSKYTEYDGDDEFKCPRNLELYQAPLITLNRNAKKRKQEPGPVRRIRASFHDSAVSFTSAMVGVSAPQHDSNLLKLVTLALNSKISHYWFFMTSVAWGVSRPSLRQAELQEFPIPIANLQNHANQLLDLYDELVELIQSGQYDDTYRQVIGEIDDVMFDIYGLSDSQEELVNSRMNTIDYYHEKHRSSVTDPAPLETREQYASWITSELNKILEYSPYALEWTAYTDEDSNSLSLHAITLQMVPEQNQSNITAPYEEVSELFSRSESDESLFYHRVQTIYESNRLHIIRPNEKRFWLTAEAINQAPEIGGDLIDRA